jgi:hypothetical protein
MIVMNIVAFIKITMAKVTRNHSYSRVSFAAKQTISIGLHWQMKMA